MIEYHKWPRRKFSVTSLKLDDQNPRLSGESNNKKFTQPQIINYLVDNEGVYELAKRIAIQGYLLNEEPIICKEGNKYVVLEGNRRVAACKILINPDLLSSSVRRKAINELLKTFNVNTILKLETRISPDRESSDVIIVNRHTEGTSIEKWDKTKQDRFFYNRVRAGESIDDLSIKFDLRRGDIRDALRRFNIYQELLNLELSESERKAIEDETQFNMTNVERFFASKVGKDFLGVEFNQDGGLSYQLPKIEYQKRLKRIALDVVKKTLNSRTFGDEKNQQAYMAKLIESPEFDLAIKGNKKFQSEYTESGKVKSEPVSKPSAVSSPKSTKVAADNKLIAEDVNWVSGVDRMDRIFKELKKANLDTQFNSAAVLFRSYLDMLTYQYLRKNNGIKELLKNEQIKLDEQNNKQFLSVKKFITELGILEIRIVEKELIKAIKQRSSISSNWVPSLKQMLSHLLASEILLDDIKLRQALGSYVKGNDNFLDHNDFNLLVHNEYFIKDAKDLKKAWEQLFPLLNYINEKIS